MDMQTQEKNTDLSRILTKAHEGKWVALSPQYDKVIDYAENLTVLAKKVGARDAVYMKPTASDCTYAF